MNIRTFIGPLLLLLSLSACIKSEEPNAEADIEACTIDESQILKTAPLVNNSTKGSYSVTFLVKKTGDITAITPHFELTEGATIEPQSGIEQDFSEPIIYTVTSQDKKWKKKYTISAVQTALPTEYSFEHIITSNEKELEYHTFVELANGRTVMEWASGNSGFASAPVPKDSPEDFPTYQANEGKKGMCAKLVTRYNGKLPTLFKKPIAAGNLFIGEFDPKNALTNPLKTTLFGSPFNERPISLKGYYKYTPGEKFINEQGEEQKDRVDQGDIYAVFYESGDDDITLNGSNSLTHESIVALARVENINKTPGNDWVFFEVPFVVKEGKTIDQEKLDNDKYKLSVVFSSSKDGAYFNGAVGSTMLIDEVELISERINE